MLYDVWICSVVALQSLCVDAGSHDVTAALADVEEASAERLAEDDVEEEVAGVVQAEDQSPPCMQKLQVDVRLVPQHVAEEDGDEADGEEDCGGQQHGCHPAVLHSDTAGQSAAMQPQLHDDQNVQDKHRQNRDTDEREEEHDSCEVEAALYAVTFVVELLDASSHEDAEHGADSHEDPDHHQRSLLGEQALRPGAEVHRNEALGRDEDHDPIGQQCELMVDEQHHIADPQRGQVENARQPIGFEDTSDEVHDVHHSQAKDGSEHRVVLEIPAFDDDDHQNIGNKSNNFDDLR